MAQDFPHLSELRGKYLRILKRHCIILRRVLKDYILSKVFRHQVWSVYVSHVSLVHIIDMKFPPLSLTIRVMSGV